ncbi:MAG: bifunctional DNA-binding transcriptional regulator/O6-methylguanine-DNA methyltransferase Ada [Thermomicrobiales bacterium]
MSLPTTLDAPASTAPITYATDDARWQAVLDHDPQADGAFFTCVHTTGIYCRPTCPARRPNRENVSFVTTREEARRAGFRPCKRCTPDNETSFPQRQTETIARACDRLQASEDRLTLEQLAAEFGMSPFHFHRVFKHVTGLTPKAYADAHRTERVRDRMTAAPSVTAAIYDAGYAANGRFYEASAQTLGMTPTRYRAGGAGAVIQATVAPCSLGHVLVAATPTGLCSVMLGDDPDRLQRSLRDRFPRAEFAPEDAAFAQIVSAVVAQIEEPARSFDLPLDIRGTAFQQRVWQALRTIPAGQTATYSEVAAAIGEPKAVRAVAQACANNRIAVVIPCHRVVGKDGSLTGYAWGTERKRALLDREQEVTVSQP